MLYLGVFDAKRINDSPSSLFSLTDFLNSSSFISPSLRNFPKNLSRDSIAETPEKTMQFEQILFPRIISTNRSINENKGITHRQGFQSGGTPRGVTPFGVTPFYRGSPPKRNINEFFFQKNGRFQKIAINWSFSTPFFLKTPKKVSRPLIPVMTTGNRKIMIILEKKWFYFLRRWAKEAHPLRKGVTPKGVTPGGWKGGTPWLETLVRH